MKLGEIKLEALRLMFVENVIDISYDALDSKLGDENYSSYLLAMPGSINRALSDIENRRIIPKKSIILAQASGEADGAYRMYTLPDDLFEIVRVERRTPLSFTPESAFTVTGGRLMLPDDRASYTLIYYPKIRRVSESDGNEAKIDIPDGIAAFLPLYIKSELYRDDEPAEASAARELYEAALARYSEKREMGGLRETVYSFAEL